jgi:hypothetical protein
MASLIIKWQKCGKKTCRCMEGFPHGPYFWLVIYISRKSADKRRGKYKWRYLGRNPQDVWTRLEQFDPRFGERYTLQDMKQKVTLLHDLHQKNPPTSTTEKIFSLEEPED